MKDDKGSRVGRRSLADRTPPMSCVQEGSWILIAIEVLAEGFGMTSVRETERNATSCQFVLLYPNRSLRNLVPCIKWFFVAVASAYTW